MVALLQPFSYPEVNSYTPDSGVLGQDSGVSPSSLKQREGKVGFAYER
jgi:hypothetical protein